MGHPLKCILLCVAATCLTQLGARADLIAYYTFDDGAPTDEAEGNDGVIEGNATPGGPGSGVLTAGATDSEAFRFGGAGHIEIPIDINPAVFPQLTVTMWVKADAAIAGAPGLYKTFGHDDGGWDRTFGLDNRNGPYRWAAFNGAGITADAGTPVTSEWTFLAAVWDSDAAGGPTVRFHADENHITEPLVVTSGHATASIGSLRPDNFNEGFRGFIDEVQIYDEALEIDEIDEIRAEVPPFEAAAPNATTLAAVSVGPGVATLRGSVRPNGMATSAWFEYGPTTNYGMTTPEVDVGAGFGDVPVSEMLSGLELDQTYHYRVVARNPLGTAMGDDASFVVPRTRLPIAHYTFDGGEPEDDTGNGNDGTLEGDAVAAIPGVFGDDEAFQFFGSGHIVLPIDINPTEIPDLTVTMWVKADPGIVDAPGLYKTFGHDDGGWDRTFGLDNRNGPYRWAAFNGAGITQATATPVTDEWTFLAGVWDTAEDGTATVRFHADENHITEALAITLSGHSTAAVGSLRPDNFNEGFQGLIDEVQIFDAALSIDEVDDIRTAVAGPDPGPPAVTSLPPQGLGPGTATLRGRVVAGGLATTAWFEYGLTTNYGMTTPEVDVGDGFSAVPLEAMLSGLEILETYHYRVVARNSLGTTAGDDVAFLVPDRRVLLARYTFEDGDATDVSGNDRHGTIEGDALPASSDRDGDEDGEALEFFGQGHIVVPIDINPTVLPDLTVTMWVRANEQVVDAPGLYKTFGHDDGGWDRTFGLDNRNGPYRWAAFNGAGITADTGTPVTGEWTFLAAVWDTAEDGTATVRFQADDLFITEPLTNTASARATAAIGNLRPDNFNEGWIGMIDDVQIFGTALSEDDIEAVREGISEPPPAPFLLPGDVNGDARYNIADAVAQLSYLFGSGALPACFTVPGDVSTLTSAGFTILDFNGDGMNNIADAVGSLGFLFGSGSPPALGPDCTGVAGDCDPTCVP